jgi:hypothetical protein
MITTFNQDEPSAVLSMDTRSSEQQGYRESYDSSNSSPLMLPASAPLKWFEDDDVYSLQDRNSTKRMGHFVADYFDRRTQAEYVSFNMVHPL